MMAEASKGREMPYRIWSPFTHRRIGRRGACLLSLGVVQVISGWTLIDTPPITFHALTIFRHLSVIALGVPWIVAGVISLVYAFVRRTDNDTWGFVAAYLMPFVWGLVYLASWFPIGDIPVGVALRAAGLYWGYAALIQVISGWSEEPPAEEVSPGGLD